MVTFMFLFAGTLAALAGFVIRQLVVREIGSRSRDRYNYIQKFRSYLENDYFVPGRLFKIDANRENNSLLCVLFEYVTQETEDLLLQAPSLLLLDRKANFDPFSDKSDITLAEAEAGNIEISVKLTFLSGEQIVKTNIKYTLFSDENNKKFNMVSFSKINNHTESLTFMGLGHINLLNKNNLLRSIAPYNIFSPFLFVPVKPDEVPQHPLLKKTKEAYLKFVDLHVPRIP